MTSAPLRTAATIILARDTISGVEVFMMKRNLNAAFVGGAYVFPGGAVDEADRQAGHAAHPRKAGIEDSPIRRADALDDEQASRILNMERGGLSYWYAAIRECFEEAGVLLACDDRGELVDLDGHESASEISELRNKVASGKLHLEDLCERFGLHLAMDRIAYFSHWVTPPNNIRRFNTRFFIAVAPPSQTPSHDNHETVDHVWINPSRALEMGRRGELQLIFPTRKTLEQIAPFGTAAALLDYARRLRAEPAVQSHERLAFGRAGPRTLGPGDYAYAEVGKLDPHGRGTASYEIIPGVPVQIAPGVRRITAQNPGFMTGPGTNGYLLHPPAGASETGVAVIDPGPADPAHVEALIALARGPIRWILATHTHIDHSPAGALLKARTGAKLVGMPAPPGSSQDASFIPDLEITEGARIEIAGHRLRVIHTPGHASNQVCYLLESEQLLFTGDHIMAGSTVVINPPDGDMTQYIDSLNRLLEFDIRWLAPGHGYLMGDPHLAIRKLVAHRLGRENKVLEKLQALGRATLEQLVPHAYDEVPPQLHRIASRSLLAHLIKLRDDARVTENAGVWRPAR